VVPVELDERIEIADFMQSGTPSIVAQNGMIQASTGNPEDDPNAQGPQGGNKKGTPEQPNGMMPQPAQDPGLMAGM